MDVRIERLVTLTAAIEQDNGMEETDKLLETVSRQGLLTESPMETPQQHLTWSNAVNRWLDALLLLLSNTQVQHCSGQGTEDPK